MLVLPALLLALAPAALAATCDPCSGGLTSCGPGEACAVIGSAPGTASSLACVPGVASSICESGANCAGGASCAPAPGLNKGIDICGDALVGEDGGDGKCPAPYSRYRRELCVPNSFLACGADGDCVTGHCLPGGFCGCPAGGAAPAPAASDAPAPAPAPTSTPAPATAPAPTPAPESSGQSGGGIANAGSPPERSSGGGFANAGSPQSGSVAGGDAAETAPFGTSQKEPEQLVTTTNPPASSAAVSVTEQAEPATTTAGLPATTEGFSTAGGSDAGATTVAVTEAVATGSSETAVTVTEAVATGSSATTVAVTEAVATGPSATTVAVTEAVATGSSATTVAVTEAVATGSSATTVAGTEAVATGSSATTVAGTEAVATGSSAADPDGTDPDASTVGSGPGATEDEDLDVVLFPAGEEAGKKEVAKGAIAGTAVTANPSATEVDEVTTVPAGLLESEPALETASGEESAPIDDDDDNLSVGDLKNTGTSLLPGSSEEPVASPGDEDDDELSTSEPTEIASATPEESSARVAPRKLPASGKNTTVATEETEEDESDATCVDVTWLVARGYGSSDFVHGGGVVSRVLCPGGGLPCGTQWHAVEVEGKTVGYGELCKSRICGEDVMEVDTLWADYAEAKRGIEVGGVKLFMHDVRFPYAAQWALHGVMRAFKLAAASHVEKTLL